MKPCMGWKMQVTMPYAELSIKVTYDGECVHHTKGTNNGKEVTVPYLRLSLVVLNVPTSHHVSVNMVKAKEGSKSCVVFSVN